MTLPDGPMTSGRPLGVFETAQVVTGEAFPFNLVVVLQVAPLPGRNDLQRALARLQQRHPMTRVRLEHRNARRWFAESAEPIPLQMRDRAADQDWQAVVESELSEPFDHHTGPLLRCQCLVPAAGDVGEIVLTIDHCVVDAVSAARIISELLGTCAALARGHEPDPEVPRSLLPPADRLLPANRRGWPLRRAFLRFAVAQLAGEVRWHLFTPRSARPGIHPSGKSHLLTFSLDTEATEALVRACRAHRVTVNSALSAALLLAVRRRLRPGDRRLPLRHFLFSDLRPYLAPRPTGEDVGSFYAMVRISLGVEPGTPFWSLATRFNDSVRASGRAGVRFASLLASLGTMRALLWTRWARMGDTALGYIGPGTVSEQHGEIHLSELHAFTSNLVLGPQYTAQTRIFAGRLWWDIVYLDCDMDPGTAQRVSDEIRQILAAATAGAA